MNRASWEDRLWVTTFLVAVASDVLSGAIRFYTSMIGAAPATYAPKVLMLLWVILVLIKRPRASHVLIALYLLAQSFVSLSQGVAPEAVGFFVWTIMPMLFALTASPGALALLGRGGARAGFFVLAALCFIGLLLNSYYPMPWIGQSVSVGGHNVSVAMSSYVGIASRLTGFGRDSASTGLMVGLLTTWLLMRTRSKLLQCALLGCAGAAVYVTTNKTAPVALALVVCAHCLLHTTTIRRGCLWAAGVAVGFPIVTFLATSAINLAGSGYVTLASFQDRMWNTWPLLIEGLLKDNRLWLGLGPGGFGSSATYYRSSFGFNVAYADNTVLYAVATFGFFGAIVLVWALVRLLLRAGPEDRASWVMMLYLLFACASTDICESIGCLLFLGVTIRYLQEAASEAHVEVMRMPYQGYVGAPGMFVDPRMDPRHQPDALVEASRVGFGRHLT
ncbi:hypothetical protein AWB79_04845 [Caballeronia hypogeia]|uniref:Uncharacterized protein n=1 Tax=Caballeronia hypogeia TaxID=1777140 RepID=A0A158C6M6_9BURK|nr:hypothetical protein [Caballeronia hypogeia]SAK77995.1 hypothetical protein AWB79_04845 [Caballeronia hypogeia]